MLWIGIGITLLILLLSFTQFEIRDQIEIHATPDRVWSVIIDFPSYHKWNTQLQFLGGEVAPNQRLHLKLSPKGADPYEFKPIISHWIDNMKFAWLAQTGFPRVFDGEHFFELTAIENGKTLLVNREEYRGLLSMVIKNLPMMKNAPEGFKLMNIELKNYIERRGRKTDL